MMAEKKNKLSEREEAIMNEAFITGRVYTKMGEKDIPSVIHQRLINNCLRVTNNVPSQDEVLSRLKEDMQRLYDEADKIGMDKFQLISYRSGISKCLKCFEEAQK